MTTLRALLLGVVPLHRRWLVLAMLGLLHLVLVVGVEHPWVRPLMISHFGVFLLWQPLWRGEAKLGTSGAAFIALAFFAVFFGLNWWMLALWLGGLLGLLGGRVFSFSAKWLRLFYLTVMLYLMSLLLLWVVPHLFAAEAITDTTRNLMQYVLPAFLLAMAVMPVEA